MQKLHYSVMIDAPPKTVWRVLFSDATYREWTTPFSPGSHFVGNWEQGSTIRFLAESDGADNGMVARVAESTPYTFLSLEHIGIVKNGVVDTTSDEVKAWLPAHENYTLKETDGGTELSIDMDSAEEYVAQFNDMWPKALAVLKAIAEAA